MPLMDLTYPAGALSADTLDELSEELTTVLLRAERAPDTDFFRTITWLHVHELPSSAVRAAGRPVPEPVFRLDVTVPGGALSDRRKQELVAEATRVISAAAGLGEADAMRIWVLIREVPDGNWGAAGQVIRFEQLRRMAASERDSAQPVPAQPAPALAAPAAASERDRAPVA
jgi:phenylpyruvate tautomerase PptA (4-oxalocrotonate tautomerase family)